MWIRMNDKEAAEKGVETTANVRQRGRRFLTDLREKQLHNVVVFTHAAFIFSAMHFVAGNQSDPVELNKPPSNCHYHEFIMQPDSFSLVRLNANY